MAAAENVASFFTRVADMQCAAVERPPLSDLLLMVAVAFVMSIIFAAVPTIFRGQSSICAKLDSLPQTTIWRARATAASLHQPIAMVYFGVPAQAHAMLVSSAPGAPPWAIQAPPQLWFALFYLFGAWLFEVCILLHPATGARRSWGRKGWWLQVTHHIGFPSFALHTLFTSCAVPGTAFACTTELTVLFTSTYWLLKVADWSDASLKGIRWANVVATIVVRGVLLLVLDVRAINSDRSMVPPLSFSVQSCALFGTNILNLMIIKLVWGAMRRSKTYSSTHQPKGTLLSYAVGTVVRTALSLLGQGACDQLLSDLLQDPAKRSNKFWADLESMVQKNMLQHTKGMWGPDALDPWGASGLPGNAGNLPISPIRFAGGFVPSAAASPGGSASGNPTSPASQRGLQPGSTEGLVSVGSMLDAIVRIAHASTGITIDPDTPLLDAGLDSKAALEFHGQLVAEFQNVHFPTTLIFDYPTLRAVAGYVAVQAGSAEATFFAGGPFGPATAAASEEVASAVPPDEPLAVTGMACAFPCGGGRPELYQQGLAFGTDGSIEVPFTRWELDEYYDENPDAPGKTYARHGAFIEGAECFDATFFGIAAPEARTMDPQQRLVLDTSFESLFDGGHSKETLMGSGVAVVVGVSNNDWIQVNSSDIKKLTPYTGTGTSASIAAARVSYALGLKGPSFIVDTACSSALVALDNAAGVIRRSRSDTAVTSAANVMASVATYISFSKPRMLSVDGRSFTFDASANGYGRGEGAGAIVLQRFRSLCGIPKAALVGSGVNQDGRSSTMTAPNGPSQQMVIQGTLREAGMVPTDVSHMECHGTGTPLGDPIELGALQAINKGRPTTSPLVLAAVKTNVGHLEGSAGSTGLLKTVALLRRDMAAACLHLRSLNPHVADLADLPKAFVSEHFPLHARTGRGTLFAGVSSFGFGGTNSHAALGKLAADGGDRSASAGPGYQRRPFPWRDPGYRLLRRAVDAGTFEVTMNADIYEVVKHHVVFGSIVVPGVVYVEMALEAARKLYGVGTHLTDVTMVFPFVIPFRTTGLEPTSQMRFALRGDTRFEIQSVSPDGKMTTHVEASLDRNPPSSLQAANLPLPDLTAIKDRVNEPIDSNVVYDAINSVGLWLGPMFQVATQVWRKEANGRLEVLGKLVLAPAVPNKGYVIHPALFDGTIHILATASIGKSVGGLMIFGGVGRVIIVRQENFSQLSQYWVHLDIKETLETSQVFDVQVMSEEGTLLMKMVDVVFRSVKPEQIQMAIAAQGTPEDEQKTYEVEWLEASGELEDSAGDAAKPLLVIGGAGDLLDSIRASLGEQHTYVSDTGSIPVDLAAYGRIVFAQGLDASAAPIEVLDAAVQVMQAAIMAKGKAPELLLLTMAAMATSVADMKESGVPLHAGLWGLARALRNEQPEVKVRAVDLPACEVVADAATRLLQNSSLQASSEPELAIRQTLDGTASQAATTQALLAPRLTESKGKSGEGASDGLSLAADGSYVISGGLGALGLAVAQWLLENNAGHVALLSRSGVPPADCRSTFKKLSSSATVRAWKADVASRSAMLDCLAQIRDQMAPLRGIFHAAGVLDDHMVADLKRQHLEAVMGAKVDGSLNLHEASVLQSLDIFALFSSIAVAIGSVGQGNYCAANSFLDSFAAYRRSRDLPAVSIQWGPWAGAGMATRAGTSEAAIVRLEVPRALAAMEAALTAGMHGVGTIGIARIKWKTLLGLMPQVPPFLSRFSNNAAGGKSTALVAAGTLSQEDIKNLVVGILKDVMDAEDIDLSIPLMEMGLDSLAGVEFRNRLQASLEGLHLSSTLMFDYPTVPDLVEYIFSQVGPGEDETAGGLALGSADVGEQLALAGHVGRVPGSCTNDIEEMWFTLLQGLETTSELPPERWDIDAYYDADPDAPGKTYVKRGHFIPGIEQFDGEFFGVGDAELRGMDPHQWLAVEISYEALHAAGHTKETANGMECGVYFGCATLGGIDMDYPAIGPFTNIGYAYSGLSGRVSHALSLRGPCFTVDTACSSAVVALDSACQAVKLGRCSSAIASAVNLQLSAAIWIGFSKMRGLAPDANCKTFDARADGFARGEGLGALFIQRAGAGNADFPPVALMSGVATNHDGRAATITAPNGTAQQRVLRAALGERMTKADDVGCLECHGTGTALGDPIEVGAQRAVYGKGHSVAEPLILAAGKSNLGHLEGTAGAAGVSKVVLAMQHRGMSPNLWLENLNPNIDLSGYHVLMPSEALQWKGQARLSGVSSFGFSGTNGHAILEVGEQVDAPARRRRPQAFNRRLLKPVKDWLQNVLYVEDWVPAQPTGSARMSDQIVVIGSGAVSKAVCVAVKGAKGVPASASSVSEFSAGLTSQPHSVVFAHCADDPGSQFPGERFQELLSFLQAVQKMQQPLQSLLVVTRGAHDVSRPSFDAGAAFWGLLRSARLEMPRTVIKALDIAATATPEEAARAVQAELAAPEADLEVRCSSQGRCVPRLVRAPTLAASMQRGDKMLDAGSLHACEQANGGTHLVTGGLGGLGLLAAQQLAELGAPSMILASRSGRVQGSGADALFQRLQAFPRLQIHLRQCDVASSSQVSDLIAEVTKTVAPIAGALHAAGVLEKRMLADLDAESLSRVMGPKASGAWHLHQHTEESNPSLFVLFSSVSSTLGLAGGASYAAANAYLDGLAAWRRERSGGLSVRFGAVSEVGMTAAAGADSRLGDKALSTLSPSQVGSALRLFLTRGGIGAWPRGEVMLARADWGAFMRELGAQVPQLSDFSAEEMGSAGMVSGAGSGADSVWAVLRPEERRAKVLTSIRSSAEAMGLTLEDDTPLMEAGIDSLSAVEFRSKISAEYRQVRMPSTLMFDYPTIKAVAEYIATQLVPSDVAAPTVLSAVADPAGTESTGALAVLGLACTLPGSARSLASLSALLAYGADCTVEVPYMRWDSAEYFDAEDTTGTKMYVKHACFIEGAELFDSSIFGIGRTEVLAMDPQQRHLLETSYAGFVDAGFTKQSLMGCLGGVFVGQDKCDWNRMLTAAHSGPFAATGGSSSISSNRVSYSLGLRGPSATMDTACSSSLVAADTAVANLRRGRCDVAVVCGVNMLLLPQTFIACCQAHMLSAGGRCRTFDNSASGYARGEGCGAQVIGSSNPVVQRAEFRGSALNQDGRSANLTSPNGPSQEAVVRAALTEAGVLLHSLDVLETHGTGTELGDPIEVGALRAVLGGPRREKPLMLGAIKSNLGHLEGGAGIAGLLKLVTVVDKNRMLPNVHLRCLNQHIYEDVHEDFAVRFPTESMASARSGGISASVSSFGFGGTNGHVVLHSSEKVTAAPGRVNVAAPKRVAFLFTGQGSQYIEMGRQLYDEDRVFHDALDKCAEVLQDQLPCPLLEVLYPKPSSADPRLIDQTRYSQPAIFSLQYALCEMWRSRGVQPCAVLGHSVGEYCAAVVAGALPLEDALRLIAARGRLIADTCEAGVGSMAAVFESEAKVSAAIAKVGAADVSIAAVNGPKMVVVSGRSTSVERVVAEIGATSRPLNVSHAFHSPLMGPALQPFLEQFGKPRLATPSTRFFSTVCGSEATEEITRPDYWVDHIKGTVHFTAAMQALDSAVQPDAYLEIGASPTLLNMAKRFLKRQAGAAGPEWLPSLDQKKGADATVVKETEGVIGATRPRPVAKFNRQPFPWREAGHPLIRQKQVRPDGATVYSCPIEGHVLELLSHHIVHGEVVVPGACYLEMILAGAAAYMGEREAWCVESLGFAKPLVLRLVDGHIEEPVHLRLVLWPDGRLELESEVGSDPDDSIVTTHVEASIRRQPGGWQANRPALDKFDLNELRKSCDEEVDIDLMYSFGVRCGLPLQPRFRAVRQVQKRGMQGLARLEMERDGTHVGFLLGPSVIDSSFQSLMSLADPEVGIGSLKIPLSLRRLQPTGRPFSIAVWNHFQLLEVTDKSSVFRSFLLNDAGEVLLHFEHVHLQEVRDEHIQRVLAASGRGDVEQQAVYATQWQPLPVVATTLEAPAPGAPSGSAAKWLVMGDAEVRSIFALEGGGDGFVFKAHGTELDMLDEDALHRTLAEETWLGVIFAHGLSESAGDVDVLTLALHLVRAAIRLGGSRGGTFAPPVWLLTSGSQPLACEVDSCRAAGSSTHAGLWGFARTVRLEYPDSIRIRCLDLDALCEDQGPLHKALSSALAELVASPDEVEVATRGSNFAVSRLARTSAAVRGPIRLNMPVRGALTNLRPVPQLQRRPVEPQFVQLRVRAVGLNFRDVLNVMGLYPGDPGPPGADCAGTVIDLGENVQHLRVAEDVFGEAPGCLSTCHVAPAPLLTQKPASWSFEEASTMPVIFVTVEESLGDLAKLKKGERVLIHAAAGGVGLVAIQYAQFVGAEVYATAGAKEKHDFLRSLGVKRITSSRSGKTFEDDMRTFLKEDGADGVDVVINSLSHDDYIPRSLDLLRQGGRFMEIGKRGVWSKEQVKERRPDVMYELIAADTMMEHEPWRYNGYLKRLLGRVEAGGLTPINIHLFNGFEQGVAALQFLQRAQNIGKVVISEPSRLMCAPKPEATSLLSGGMGALGLVTARYLVEEGSKSVCLLSRGGKPAADAMARWDWLKSSVAQIIVERCDVSSKDAVLSLKKVAKSPFVSLFHLAGVLDDGMIDKLSSNSFRRSYAPKVHGLHHLCGLPFEDGAPFILFSSTSSLFGSLGQANYAASNSVLDSLAPRWSAEGLRRARAIQWGPWAEVGMAVNEAGTLQRAKAGGVGALGSAQGAAIMGSILMGEEIVVGAVHVKWAKFLRVAYEEPPRFLEALEAEAKRAAPAENEVGEGSGLMGVLATLPADERLVAVRNAIHAMAREVVDDDGLAVDAPLLESGMDSLSGVEFRNRLLKEFTGVKLPNSAVFDHPSVDALAMFVDGQLGDAAAAASAVTAASPSAFDAAASAGAVAPSGARVPMVERLNERTVGVALLLIPGAGMQAASLQAMASLLPVPVYGFSWPAGVMPRAEWPASLKELAGLILRELRAAMGGGGAFALAGHSFGAAVALEVARCAEAAGESVPLTVLLDSRHVPPVGSHVASAFRDSGLVDTLAILSQSGGADGVSAPYADLLEELSAIDSRDEREALLRSRLSSAVVGSLEHMAETNRWYAGLLCSGGEETTCRPLESRLLLLQAAETWHGEAPEGTGKVEEHARAFQATVFQSNEEVLRHLQVWAGAKEFRVAPMPGGHFGVLREPHVVGTALRLCSALAETVDEQVA